MSSRDIGPALPPHMRSFDEERNDDEQDERRRKHRDKYSERERERDRERDRDRKSYRERERDRDRERERDRDREKDRERDRSRRDEFKGRERERPSRYSNERYGNRHMPREQESDERVQSKRGKINLETAKREGHTSSLKRSKRSKTDRTYNTDTEESSDDDESYAKQEWTRGNKSNNSESEEEDTSKKEESGSEESDTIGPVLPPRFPIKSSKELSGGSNENLDFCANSNQTSNLQSSSENLPCSEFEDEPELNINENKIDLVGPALPPHLIKSDLGKAKDTIGPALPPGLRDRTTQIEEENVSIGPALPPHLKREFDRDGEKSESSIGPALPPHLQSREASTSNMAGRAIPAHPKTTEESDEDATDIGPALPPKFNRPLILGPCLPPGLDIAKYSEEARDASSDDDDDDDDEVVGPLLPGEMIRNEKNYVVQAQLERNAAAIKRKLEEKDLPGSDANRREDWMLELPPEGTVDLGLGPRTFRARGAPEKGADRSMWTDTPADKAKKEEEAKRRFELGITSTEEVKKEALSKNTSSKDKSMEAIVKKHKRSKESLLDAHQKKIEKEKKKKEKAGVKQERRPFNRDTDLKTNVFDDAQKKAIYKKAQFLDSRFSSGESKFL